MHHIFWTHRILVGAGARRGTAGVSSRVEMNRYPRPLVPCVRQTGKALAVYVTDRTGIGQKRPEPCRSVTNIARALPVCHGELARRKAGAFPRATGGRAVSPLRRAQRPPRAGSRKGAARDASWVARVDAEAFLDVVDAVLDVVAVHVHPLGDERRPALVNQVLEQELEVVAARLLVALCHRVNDAPRKRRPHEAVAPSGLLDQRVDGELVERDHALPIVYERRRDALLVRPLAKRARRLRLTEGHLGIRELGELRPTPAEQPVALHEVLELPRDRGLAHGAGPLRAVQRAARGLAVEAQDDDSASHDHRACGHHGR